MPHNSRKCGPILIILLHEATTAEIPPRYEPNISYVGGSAAA